MKSEDIRRLYRAVDEATAAEAAETANEARRDPEQARRLIKTLYSLSVEDRNFAMLLDMFLEGMLMRFIEERANDDLYALECGQLIVELMEKALPPERGRKTARSA
jgi:hypothetical protein